MTLNRDEEQQVRVYLLGNLAQERARKLEERLLQDDNFVEQVMLVEDEVIEDYVRGTLSPVEKSRFERHFLSTPRRRQKLMMVASLRQHAMAMPGDAELEAALRASPWTSWVGSLFTPRWRAVALAVLVLAAGLVMWRAFFSRSDVDKAMIALNKAYEQGRPLQARITGLDYAPFTGIRGDEKQVERGDARAREGRVDERARDLSASLLQNAANEDPSPSTLHALGLSYLAQKEFDKAIFQFEQALKTAPNDARLHAALGAALFEKGKLERSKGESDRSETTLAESLKRLNRALELNYSMLEARFNRALLYQALSLPRQAREDWEKYLSQDSSSQWAQEARSHLEIIKKQEGGVSRREQNLFRDFLQA